MELSVNLWRKGRMKAILTCLCATVMLAAPAAAAPPFTTDDPEPVGYQHVELDYYTQFTGTKNGTTGAVPGVQAVYGILPDLEVHIIAALAYADGSGKASQYGVGDTELGTKYKFIHQNDNGMPDVSFAPLVQFPTGDAHENLGAGNTREFFPLWAEKDFGDWQTYGGGGYWNNPGSGNSNYWFFGWVLQKKITDKITFGGEVFHQTANLTHGNDSTGFNLGGTYIITDKYNILFAAGRGLQNANTTNQFSTYLALQAEY
jgi:hypothetical protein